MRNSNRGPLPEKPHPDFPLFPHQTHRWAKKINGQTKYFGSTDSDPKGEAALANYHDRIAGRPAKAEGLTIADLCNRFLSAKQQQMESGELVMRTWLNYKMATDMLVAFFGKYHVVDTLTPKHFEDLRAHIAKGRGPVAVTHFVQLIRICFKYAHDATLIERPVRYGASFKIPSKMVLRKYRALKGSRMLEAEEIRAVLEIAGVPMKAMILLGINAGFGNSDCGQLPISALDLSKGWVRFPRPKTGVDRRCPLWPETIEALEKAIAERPAPKYPANNGLAFITIHGQAWFIDGKPDSPACKLFRRMLDELNIYRPGLGFYSLRRSFETVAGSSRDQVATDFVMGHSPASDDMAAVYRQWLDDDRLQAVVKHVHTWLFPPEPKPKRKPRAK